MASILYAYHNGEWKCERFGSLNEARAVAYLGEKRGVLVALRILREKYYKGQTTYKVQYDRKHHGPAVEYFEGLPVLDYGNAVDLVRT